MSNKVGTQASRDEEIAFLCIEDVLGVEILLADSGSGDAQPDGCWRISDDPNSLAYVEQTSPECRKNLKERAQQMREVCTGERDFIEESGVIEFNGQSAAEQISALLREQWAKDNIKKLNAKQAAERHLYLTQRTHKQVLLFSDLGALLSGDEEIDFPDGLTDLWLEGLYNATAQSGYPPESFTVNLVHCNREKGCEEHQVHIREEELPAPKNKNIRTVPHFLRSPKQRTSLHTPN